MRESGYTGGLLSHFFYFQYSWPYSNSLSSYSSTTCEAWLTAVRFRRPFSLTLQYRTNEWRHLRIVAYYSATRKTKRCFSKEISARKSLFFIKRILSIASSLHRRHWNSNVLQLDQTQYHYTSYSFNQLNCKTIKSYRPAITVSPWEAAADF